ncbi:gp132L [Rabbit fibroma virus]|uniref:Gp132L n=1 Tax=Rabbit fibroma virus (strain Kasza) TaxID=10272 RepID=Q9Q8U6_RFVKA|nr:gp132L [Rabbit fibroma virus]AAF18015.1 gp132L [Rabbit fibroma virus]
MGNLLYCCFVVDVTTPSIQRYVNEQVNLDKFLSRRKKKSILLYLLKVIRNDKLLTEVYCSKKYSELYGCKNPNTEVVNFINYILIYLNALSYTQKRLLYIIIAENMITSFIEYINAVFTSSSTVKFKDSERCIEELFIETGLYISSSQGYNKQHTEVMEELIYLYILAKLFKQLL